MAAFSSNIDITSGGTYGMDVTNGESSLKVANDLNGKMANIQQYLQNGLPEVWTGDSLPDSLPNGNKIINHDSNLYFNNNLLRLLTQNDLTEINNSIDNIVNTEIPQQINNSIIYGMSYTNSTNTSKKINIGTPYRYVIIVANPGAGSSLLTGIFSANDSSKDFTGGEVGTSYYTKLSITFIKSTSFNVQYFYRRDSTNYSSTNISYIAFI